MKTVVTYTRVSTDEQSFGYSLTDQDIRLTEYCNRNDYIIASKFKDDYSAKTFERPDFQRMLTFLKANKINEVIFIKWTRFSRNATDALLMIRTLAKMGIGVQAIDEPIDFSVPQMKFMLHIYLAGGEIDNDMRSEATTRGIRRAKAEGKWVNRAPLGYLNKRDEKNKPYLVIDEQTSQQVKRLFELMATGDYSQDQVRSQIKKEGLKICKTRFAKMLKQPLYCGQIYIQAYKKEQPQTVKGIHEPLISETLFYRVQEVIKSHLRIKVKKYRKVSDEFPLNGFLYCPQDHRMTFSHSRGRHGNLFPYYHCANHLKCARCRAQEANQSFTEHLGTFVPDERAIEDLRFFMQVKAKEEGNTSQIKRTIVQQETRIQVLQDKLIDGLITDEDYRQMRSRYESDLFTLKSKVAFLSEIEKQLESDIEDCTKILTNLPEFYISASTEGKRNLVTLLITTTGKVIFDDETNKCRTPVLDPLIKLFIKPDAASSEGKILHLEEIRDNVPFGSERGTDSRTIFSLHAWAQTYKLLTKRA